MKNHAFLIQAHAYQDLLDKLVFKINSYNHYIFIHLDKKSTIKTDELKCLKLNNVTLLQKYKVKWGGISQVLATLSLLKVANKHSVRFDCYHLISGQDYLCTNNQKIDDFFENTDKNYIECCNQSDMYLYRMDRFHFFDILSKEKKLSKCIIRGFDMIQSWLMLCIQLRPSLTFEMKMGSSWWSLNQEAIIYICTFLEKNPSYIKRFKHTACCDEIFFQSIIYNSNLSSSCVNRNYRYILWKDGASSPCVLTENEYDSIIKSESLFCRKIDMHISSNLVKLIDGNA